MDHTCKIETTKSRGQHNVGQRDLEQRESFLFAALKLSAQELNVSEDAGTTSSAAVQCSDWSPAGGTPCGTEL